MKKVVFALILVFPFVSLAEKQLVDPEAVSIVQESGTASILSLPSGLKKLRQSGRFHVVGSKKGNKAVPFDSNLEAQIAAKCANLKAKNPSILSCGPRYAYHALAVPNDPSYSTLWGLSKASLASAWDRSTGSSAMRVAVVDTGVDYNHPDLSANVNSSLGYDFQNGDSNPMDDNGHGTHVAGTIGAKGNNGVGVVGVNWNITIIPVKVLDAEGSGYTDTIADGIIWAADRGAKVINMSLGGAGYTQDMYDAILYARNKGVLVVCAAGNEASNNDTYPSYPASFNLANIISVAATASNDSLAYFSNYGTNSVHIAAPGVTILSTLPNSSYSSYSGTSMAAPHVAGVAALLLSYNSSLTYSQVKATILNSADIVSSLNPYTTTGGRLNAAAAIAAAGSSNPPVEPTVGPEPTEEPDDPYDPEDPDDPSTDPDPNPESNPVLDIAYNLIKQTKQVNIRTHLYDTDSGANLHPGSIRVVCNNRRIGTKAVNTLGRANFRIRYPSRPLSCYAIGAYDIYTLYSYRIRIRPPRR